ncbi:hypothetical protein FD755_007495 [Muntiacus reevesi]|uniref:C2 domain-containing protein n=1 Tax=Muntiacus reevesi TaxID=9886 RepID=A0A5J5MK27_MUNRE|nr:hypothetical protein FD755_007495 [Muntiacus reevesi]
MSSEIRGFPGGSVVESQPAIAGDERDSGSIPESGRSPGEGNGNPLQYSCLENSMDRGAWWATRTHLLPASHILISSLLLFCCFCPLTVPLSVGVWTGCSVSGAFGSWKGKCRLIHRRMTRRWGSTCGNVRPCPRHTRAHPPRAPREPTHPCPAGADTETWGHTVTIPEPAPRPMSGPHLGVQKSWRKLSAKLCSQNDMTSDKQHPETVPSQREGRPERRSLSDTAINASTRQVSTPDILKPLSPESPRRLTSPVLKQEDISPSPVLNTLFSGGLRQGSLISINSTCTEMGNFDNANVTGEIEFAICYCLRTHSLEICIRACKNLAFGEEKKKKCNPYVKTYLLPDRSSQGKRKTSVQKNTVEPTFQETLKYQVELAQLASRQLQVSVWHLGVLTRRVFLGEVIVPLATWDFEDRASQSFRWYPLRAKAEKSEDSLPTNNGELAVRAKLVLPAGPREPQEAPEGTGDEPSQNGQLCLVVLGAKNLPVRSDGTLNSFVKGCLTLPDQQRLRLKSPVLKKQACPQWKHSFVFKGVTPSQLRQSSLELTVWDQATFGVNDRFLGGARLGLKEDLPGGAHTSSQAKLQWQKVLSSPNLWTDMTLILR